MRNFIEEIGSYVLGVAMVTVFTLVMIILRGGGGAILDGDLIGMAYYLFLGGY